MHCPELEDRAKIVRLLRPERIVPEQATDAVVVHHPEAKYFNT